MKNTWRHLILLLCVLLVASCSPSLTEAEMTATQQALYSPTPTKTSTPTPTSTAAPTITLTPTATQPAVEVEVLEDGTTLVRHLDYGVQFELPRDWIYNQPSPDSTGLGFAAYEAGGGLRVTLDMSIDEHSRSPEEFLDDRLFFYRDGFGLTIHRQGTTTNQYGVPLAYLEASGQFNSSDLHVYSLFFRARGLSFHFNFGGDLNIVQNAIAAIQASFQYID